MKNKNLYRQKKIYIYIYINIRIYLERNRIKKKVYKIQLGKERATTQKKLFIQNIIKIRESAVKTVTTEK